MIFCRVLTGQLMLPMYYITMATRREPVNESSVTINHKFRGLLGAYIKLAQHAGSFNLPGPWGPEAGGGPATPEPESRRGERMTTVEAGQGDA